MEAAGKRRPRKNESDPGTPDNDRYGAIYHPERGRLSTYIAEVRRSLFLTVLDFIRVGQINK